MVASLEQSSEHPLAAAIVRAQKIKVSPSRRSKTFAR